MPDVRPAAVAGAFYPADTAELAAQVTDLLAAAGGPAGEPDALPKAIIAPHAGYVYSGPVAASAYARLTPAKGRVARVVLIGPAHYVGFRGLAASTAEAWRTPLGTVPLDRATIDRLVRAGLARALDAAHAPEHSLEVHLPFLQKVLGRFALVPIVAGAAAPEAVAALLDAVWGGPETLIVISTDLSHYLDYRACQATDRRTAAAIERLAADELAPDGACGHVGLGGLLQAARRRGLRIERLDLRNSGDTAGPPDRVVGYGSWALFEAPSAGRRADTEEDEEAAIAAAGPELLALARGAIAMAVAGGAPARPPADLQAILAAPGAAFVTLKRRGELRGCIGSAAARRPLAEDVVDNAYKAALFDPRFPPLCAEELDGLDVSISVLSTLEPIPAGDEAALLAALRPGEDGLVIEDGGRRALFLPSVWEHLPEPRLFLEQLKLKAGLPADQWSPGFTAWRFRTVEVPETRRATGAAGARRRGGTPQNSEMPRSSAMPIAASAAPARR